MSDAKSQLDIVVARYKEAALGTSDPNPKVANKWATRVHGCYKKLRETEAGRAAIVNLMSEPSPHIASWAAAHALGWASELAIPVLERIRDAGGPCSFDAKVALIEFRAGRLTFGD